MAANNEDLQNEVEAINSIYGDDSFKRAEDEDLYILYLPHQEISLRLRFPSEYPAIPPSVLGTHSSGEHTRKGDAAYVVDVFRDTLGRLFKPGEVCLFDVIEEANEILESAREEEVESEAHNVDEATRLENPAKLLSALQSSLPDEEPPWTLSEVVIELKSVFIARCAPVSTPPQAKGYLAHLLESDKKVRSATHNITAWRIRGGNGITFQDCDDDGETAAGGRVLHLMQLMDICDVMVVVTRWYGGHQLGPKRFSIINSVARDAFVRGGFVKEGEEGKKKGKR
jgi:hypothetical protein